MQYEIPHEEEGCFVFEVVNNPICARSQPNILTEDSTRLEFEVGELVSIDLIQHSMTDKNNGPYLRLTDRSGWLFGHCMGQERLRRLTVQRGLWTLFVDNFPNGQYLRRHPVVSPDLDFELDGENVLYEPGTKLYCDAKVVHPSDGIVFYRVQGTRGWVFDHKPSTDYSPALSMLLAEHQVRTGLFCYQAVKDIVIRLKPSTNEEFMTREVIKAGEMVAVDYIRDCCNETSSSGSAADGPFLRLADGMGWLFAKKQGKAMMENITILEGSWVVKCLNAPVGVGLRRHPIVCQDKLYPIVYPTGSMVQCNCKVVAPDGTVFYHITGTRGWLFDRRGSDFVLELITSDENDATPCMHDPWEPNFVRGVAATVEDIRERKLTIADEKGVLTFERQNDGDGSSNTLYVHVYCQSRTVLVMDSQDEECQICERNCTTKKLISMFNHDFAAPTSTTAITEQKVSSTLALDADPAPKDNEASPPVPVDLHISQDEIHEIQSQGDVGVEIVSPANDDEMNHKEESPPPPPCDNAKDKQETREDDMDQEPLESTPNVRVNEEKSCVAPDLIDTDPDEYALRQELLDLESVENKTRVKRMQLLEKLKLFDDERCAESAEAKRLVEERVKEMKAKEAEDISLQEEKVETQDHHNSVQLVLGNIPENEQSANLSYLGRIKLDSPSSHALSPRSQTSVKSRRSTKSRSSSRREFQCGECDEIFTTPEDREDHCREEHGIVCEVCKKAFKSFRVLDLHKDRNDHW